jgi:hypothetical protein
MRGSANQHHRNPQIQRLPDAIGGENRKPPLFCQRQTGAVSKGKPKGLQRLTTYRFWKCSNIWAYVARPRKMGFMQ